MPPSILAKNVKILRQFQAQEDKIKSGLNILKSYERMQKF